MLSTTSACLRWESSWGRENEGQGCRGKAVTISRCREILKLVCLPSGRRYLTRASPVCPMQVM